MSPSIGKPHLYWFNIYRFNIAILSALFATVFSRLLERFPPTQVLWAGPTHATPSARSLQTALSEAGIVPIAAQSGQAIDLGEGAALRVLSANQRGAVLLVEWGGFLALLPFGVDVEALKALQSDAGTGPLSALLLAESGYARSTRGGGSSG